MDSAAFLQLHRPWTASAERMAFENHVRWVADCISLPAQELLPLMLRKKELLQYYDASVARRVYKAYLFDLPFPEEVHTSDLREWLTATRDVRLLLSE